MFYPDQDISRSEAYAMIMSATCMDTSGSSPDWQRNVYNVASAHGMTIREWSTFAPNAPILRQELFVLASRAADWAERTG